jgi:hypothetical protein
LTRAQARSPAALLLVLVLVAAAAGAAITWIVGRQRADTASTSSAAGPASERSGGPVVKTTLPGLVAPAGEPMLPSIRAAHPAAGEVVVAEGPFDDRFTLTRLRLDRTRIRGVLTVTSDVSELLDLQVLVGFYDRSGRLLGTNRYMHSGGEHHEADSGTPSEAVRFSVAVPRSQRDRVASAAVGVPVLVNE